MYVYMYPINIIQFNQSRTDDATVYVLGYQSK